VKIIRSLAIYLLLFILVVGFFIAKSETAKNLFFYKSGLISKEIFMLNDKINLSLPEDTSEKRIVLLKQVDDFAKRSVVGKGFSSNMYSLIKIRLDQVLKEIPKTQVAKGKVKIWYIYNMGIIAKSADKTIAFDLGSASVYSSMPEFTKYIDVLITTHFHVDHFDFRVIKEALKNNVTVIIPNNKVSYVRNQFIKDANGEDTITVLKKQNGVDSVNLIAIKPQEKTIIKGVEITAYPANHYFNSDDPNNSADIMNAPVNWYYVNLSGITLLHMGDGTSFDNQPDFTNKNIDVFITHNFDPRTNDNLIKFVPNVKTIIPLHVWELEHGAGIIDYMSYEKNILDDYSNGYFRSSQSGPRFLPMIWGESLLF
jgi:L-ascorbate metabolism protein UlaG (beta-lactamase superfamily)